MTTRNAECMFEEKLLKEAGITIENGKFCIARDLEAKYQDEIRVGQNFAEKDIQTYLDKFYHNDVARYIAYWEETNNKKILDSKSTR